MNETWRNPLKTRFQASPLTPVSPRRFLRPRVAEKIKYACYTTPAISSRQHAEIARRHADIDAGKGIRLSEAKRRLGEA